MKDDQWDEALERMLDESNQKVVEHEKQWDVTLQKLADQWNASY